MISQRKCAIILYINRLCERVAYLNGLQLKNSEGEALTLTDLRSLISSLYCTGPCKA